MSSSFSDRGTQLERAAELDSPPGEEACCRLDAHAATGFHRSRLGVLDARSTSRLAARVPAGEHDGLVRLIGQQMKSEA